jgi:predicted O-methyltransferase YrrM
MGLLSAEIEQYIDAHTESENELLAQLNRDTHVRILKPRMLSGNYQGRLLAMLARLLKPSRILEIGTFTGYSALCLCEGLIPDGKLYTIDVNEELESFTRSFFDRSPYHQQIDYRIGKALDVIPTIEDEFDLVFIDADKANYATYFDLIIDRVRPGGLIIADNVLWDGKVVGNVKANDKDTHALLAFNDKVHKDERVHNVLLPIRDGLMLLEKI